MYLCSTTETNVSQVPVVSLQKTNHKHGVYYKFLESDGNTPKLQLKYVQFSKAPRVHSKFTTIHLSGTRSLVNWFAEFQENIDKAINGDFDLDDNLQFIRFSGKDKYIYLRFGEAYDSLSNFGKLGYYTLDIELRGFLRKNSDGRLLTDFRLFQVTVEDPPQLEEYAIVSSEEEVEGEISSDEFCDPVIIDATYNDLHSSIQNRLGEVTQTIEKLNGLRDQFEKMLQEFVVENGTDEKVRVLNRVYERFVQIENENSFLTKNI
jgi:hypothetical protein